MTPGAVNPFEVLDYDGESVEVDAEIAPLIELCWSHGLDTFNSCQDFDGLVWVGFDGPSATEFLNLVAGQDRQLRNHMLHDCGRGWTYSVLPWPGWGDDPAEIRFLVSVHFPRDQLPAVVAALQNAPPEENE